MACGFGCYDSEDFSCNLWESICILDTSISPEMSFGRRRSRCFVVIHYHYEVSYIDIRVGKVFVTKYYVVIVLGNQYFY